jgi:hypothetical protein
MFETRELAFQPQFGFWRGFAPYRNAITSMILGGILLFGAAQFAPLILGG